MNASVPVAAVSAPETLASPVPATPAWASLLTVRGATFEERQVERRCCDAALADLTRVDGLVALRCNGFNLASRQHVLYLSLVEGRPELTRRAVSALGELLPYLTPTRSVYEPAGLSRGVRIGIHESTFGSRGSCYLVLHPERSVYDLRCLRRTKVTVLHSASDLEALLPIVEAECYLRADRKAA